MKVFWSILFSIGICSCGNQRHRQASTIDFLRDSVSKELQVRVPLDAISFTKNFQLDTLHPTIIATVKLDQLNGGCFIYQWKKDKYHLSYRKTEPVYQLQLSSTGRHLVFESGFTGTGQKKTFFYLLELNPASVIETWKAAASDYNFTSIGPYRVLDGSVQLSSHDHNLIYSTIRRVYNNTEMDLNKPDSINSTSEFVVFNQLPGKNR